MSKRLPDVDSAPSPGEEALAAFHAGSRRALEAAYRDNFGAVDAAVGRVLSGADKETVVHEVFFRIISRPELRLAYRGGSMAAWLSAIAKNHAIDFARRRHRERPGEDAEGALLETAPDPGAEERRLEAHVLIERFRRDYLPAKWAPVFELRFLQHLDQRDAAAQLRIGRTTLAYREYCVSKLLRRFLLGGARS